MRDAGTPPAGARAGVSPGRVLAAVLGWPALAFFLLKAPAWAFTVLVLAVCGLAAWEFLGLCEVAGSPRVVTLVLAVSWCASSAAGGSAFLAALAATSVVLAASTLFLPLRDPHSGSNLSTAAAAGMLYLALPLALLLLTRQAPGGCAAALRAGQLGLDMGAYVGGALRGRPLRADPTRGSTSRER